MATSKRKVTTQMKTLVLILLFSITTWAILPAKEALKETDQNIIRLERLKDKNRKKCFKAWEDSINQDIERLIKNGACEAWEDQQCQSDYETDVRDTNILKEKYIKAGYKILPNPWTPNTPTSFVINWCNAK